MPNPERDEAGEAGDLQGRVVAFLKDAASHGGGCVEVIETHASIIFLAGDRAYKLKRAIRLPFLDYSTVDKRERACRAELRLNRRTAPDVYLDVQAVVRWPEGDIGWGPGGETLDWVVVMRRFGQDALLDHLATRNAFTAEMAIALADHVAAFHQAAETGPPDRQPGAAASFLRNLESTLNSLHQAGRLSRELEQAARAMAGRCAPEIERRQRGGFVRRCHGDLHLHNVCLIDGQPLLFDAIEFDPTLGWIDVVHDLAFLLMDLGCRGLRPIANLVLNRWLTRTGDIEGLALLPMTLADRALVRAKVAFLMADKMKGEEASAKSAEGEAYLSAAAGYLNPPPPQVLAVGGLSGTGKSTIARRITPGLGPAPGAVHLRSDAIRKEMYGVEEQERLPEAAYAEEVSRRVFAEIAARTARALAAGQAVVADAVFGHRAQRDMLAAAADRAGVPFTGVWLDAPERVMVDRIAGRCGDASDATAEIARAQIAAGLSAPEWHHLSAAGTADEVADAVRAGLPPDAV